MQVKDRMTPDPMTITEDTSFQNALQIMKEKKIRRLPVVNRDGALVGIVTDVDLFSASPSPATSLSVFEVHYLLSKMKMGSVMTKRVITVGSDCPLEEAARIMIDHRIGCLPAVDQNRLVGIITETDLFRTFVEVLGGRDKGLRLTLDVTEKRGALVEIAGEIFKANGNILTLATFRGTDPTDRIITVKVADADKEALLDGLRSQGVVVLNAVEISERGYPYRILGEKG